MRILQIASFSMLCIVIAGCPVVNNLCEESQRGDFCTGVDEGCMCMDEVEINGAVWSRDMTNEEPVNFKVDDRNMNTVTMKLSNYNPDLGEKETRLVYDENGDGNITQNEVLFSGFPDENGITTGSFIMPASSIFSGKVEWEVLEVESIVLTGFLCATTPNCYIQIGGGGTTPCTANAHHLADFINPEDCYYENDGNLDFAFGIALPDGTVPPGTPVEITVSSIEYTDVFLPLLASPTTMTVTMEDDEFTSWMVSAGLITLSVPAGGTGPGNYEVCLDISMTGMNCTLKEVCADFVLKRCNDC